MSDVLQKEKKKVLFGQTINDVHQVILQENAEVIKPFKDKSIESYEQAVKNPNKVHFAGMTFRPKGEIMYRGEAMIEVEIDPDTRQFEVTQGKQEVSYGDLFILKGLHLDDAFGFALCEAIKRVFKGKQIYDIRLKLPFKVCYSLEINKNRAYFGVTLVDEDELNDRLSMDEKMFIELACNLTYAIFAQINKLENPLTEQEILAMQEEYKILNQNFMENNSDAANSGKWDKVRQYEVISRDAATKEIIEVAQYDNGVATRGSSSIYQQLMDRVERFKSKFKH